MRKFTLLFMSMFLMLGTLTAQNDTPESFELVSVSPKDGEMVTTVYNIRLEFTKDVTVTLPEGGIDVTNNDTKEVVKITRIYSDEWTPKNVVNFLFEQKKAPGKDGKEELQDQYIETAGNYSYTIPAGCIKSVDGEEFAGQTFTFSVVSTFPYVSYSPTKTDKLEKIDITFEKEIINVVMPNNGMMIADLYYTTFVNIKKDVTISEDKKTVTLELESPITTPGQYFLDLYNGVFISADGINENASLVFNVIDSRPSFSTNYESGKRVKEIGDLEITFNNVKEVKLVEGADPIAAYIPGGGEVIGTTTLADNKITVSFGQTFTEQGEYLLYIPAGVFTMDGVPNELREVSLEVFVADITPLQIVSVSPEVGAVETLSKITITFNQPIRLSFDEDWQEISREITLTCGDKTYTLTNNPDYTTSTSDKLVYLVNAEWNGFEFASTPITEAGTYTLNLSEIVVDYASEQGIDEWGYPATIWNAKNYSLAGTYSWTVTGGTSIGKIEVAEGEQAIYDLLGRRVEKITGAGIYIVNGKKVVIK